MADTLRQRPSWRVWLLLLLTALALLLLVALNLQTRKTAEEATPTPTPSFLLSAVEECGNLLVSPPWVCVQGGLAVAQSESAVGMAWGAGFPLVVPGERYGPDTFAQSGDVFCQGGEWGGFCVRGDYAGREYLATRIIVRPPSVAPGPQAP